MKMLIAMLALSLPLVTKPIKIVTVEEEAEKENCFICSDEIPCYDSHFAYDPDHLVCTHCYFYRINPTKLDPAPQYIAKNGKDLQKNEA